MNPFKKKAKFGTIQDAQTEFNQALFHLGDLNYRKVMIKQSLTQLENEIVETTKKLDSIGKAGQELARKAQEELKKTIKAVPNAPADAPKA